MAFTFLPGKQLGVLLSTRGTAMRRLSSSQKDSRFCVRIADARFAPTGVHCEVPQGPVLGPVLFIYMLLLDLFLRSIIFHFNKNYHGPATNQLTDLLLEIH